MKAASTQEIILWVAVLLQMYSYTHWQSSVQTAFALAFSLTQPSKDIASPLHHRTLKNLELQDHCSVMMVYCHNLLFSSYLLKINL